MDEIILEEQAPEPQQIIECPLRVDMVAECLGLLLKSISGEGYMYTRLNLSNKKLTDIDALKWYCHLFYVDISKNYIQNIDALEDMSYLLSLNASFNKITDISMINCSLYLTEINLEKNEIEILPQISIHYLKVLNLNHNKIIKLTDEEDQVLIHANFLTHLELRGNLLTTTAGICLPRLTHLYMANNQIVTIKGLSDHHFLEILHLRDNKLEILDGFLENIPLLNYLNLKNNKIALQVEIQKLVNLQILNHLVLKENPIEEDEEYRILVLRSIPHLNRLDKDEYEDEDREQIKEENTPEEILQAE